MNLRLQGNFCAIGGRTTPIGNLFVGSFFGHLADDRGRVSGVIAATPLSGDRDDPSVDCAPDARGISGFLDASKYPFVETLQGNAPVIREELDRLLTVDRFQPYPEKALYDGRWDVFGFYWFGERISGNCAKCPRTARIIGQVPHLVSAGFSRLAAGAVIRSHVGFTGEVLRCHLGLITSSLCGIRVGSEVRQWEQSKCLIFDDTVEHEAWNRSGMDRIVLLLDFLRNPGASPGVPRPPAHVPGPGASRAGQAP